MRKYGVLLIILVLCISLTACDFADYKKAAEQFDAKNYEAALPMYTALGDYEDSAEKAKECNYQIGLLALENEEWDKAISSFENSDYKDSAEKLKECNYQIGLLALENEEWGKAISSFENSDYKDSAEKLKFCQREKGMHEKADYAFLEAIVESIQERSNQVNRNTDERTLVHSETAILGEFKIKEFYDKDLGRLAKAYLRGLDKQEDALELQYSEKQIKWQEGMVERMEVLKELHDDYGIFKDDADFRRDYLIPLPSYKDSLKALKAIENDLGRQLDDYEFQYESRYYRFAEYRNNTPYDFDVQMYFTFYDQNNVRIDDSVNYFPNIKSHDECKLSIYCPPHWHTCEFFWDIIPH